MTYASADTLTFFRAWLSDPLRVASVIPSSDHLAELITSEVEPANGPVLELGPGTGVFTRSLIRRGVMEQDLTLIELGAEFANMLALRYPEATIARLDAARLSSGEIALRRMHGAAISGLPLLSMPPRKVLRILSSAFQQLDTNACFYQFTYGWRCPVPKTILDRLGLRTARIGTVLSNLPPASVYRISRTKPEGAGDAVVAAPCHLIRSEP